MTGEKLARVTSAWSSPSWPSPDDLNGANDAADPEYEATLAYLRTVERFDADGRCKTCRAKPGEHWDDRGPPRYVCPWVDFDAQAAP